MNNKNDISDWLAIDEGVTACTLNSEVPATRRLELSAREMIWASSLSGASDLRIANSPVQKTLDRSDSVLLFWPRGDWDLLLSTAGESTTAIFRITLSALHNMLSVDFAGQENARFAGDTRQMTRVVHFSPLIIRQLNRIFVKGHNSKFTAISRRGIFYDVFAEMLESVYGDNTDKCPFQIDVEMEHKLRLAHQILVGDLRNLPDLNVLAAEVELPRHVVRDGFQYLYGQSIQDYHQEYKFEEARAMLESGKYLIKEIAYKLGYHNPSHFISAFKQRFGTTPKQWAMQHSA